VNRNKYDSLDVVLQHAPACESCGWGEDTAFVVQRLVWSRVGRSTVTWACEACEHIQETDVTRATIVTYGRSLFFVMPKQGGE
jgi:hypothetical protein